MAQDWDIKLRGNACSACEKLFADKERCFSALFFSENGYERRDYCAPCWEALSVDPAPVSTWHGRFRAPAPKPEDPLKHETAESLLRRLMEDDDESKMNIIYILAVMLERKKLFVERDVQTQGDGQTVRVYEHRKTGETFLIPEPELRLDQLEHVQTEVVAMLGGGERKKAARTEEEAESDAAGEAESDGAKAGEGDQDTAAARTRPDNEAAS